MSPAIVSYATLLAALREQDRRRELFGKVVKPLENIDAAMLLKALTPDGPPAETNERPKTQPDSGADPIS